MNAKDAAPDRHEEQRQPRRYLLWAVVVAIVAIAVWAGWKIFFKPKPKKPPPPVPVVVAVVAAHDVPVYLTGLGAVKAYNTVTVHTQIDGTLQSVDFVEGQQVRAGQLLAQIDPRPLQAQLEQAIATRIKDAASLANAEHDLHRYDELAREDSIAVQQRDTQAALVRQDEAAVQTDQAQVDYAKVQLSYTSLRSPIGGVTGVRMVDAGNLVHADDPGGIVVVTQIEPISVTFTLPEDDIDVVRRELAKGTLYVDATARGGGRLLGTGSVLLVNNQIDPTTGTVELKATFPNRDHALWPGEFVDARLLVYTHHDAVTVPSAAVQRGPQGTYAYVIDAGGNAKMVAVRVSDENAGGPQAVIDTGLRAGERVVTDGQLKLHAGAKVKIVTDAAGSAASSAAEAPEASSDAAASP